MSVALFCNFSLPRCQPKSMVSTTCQPWRLIPMSASLNFQRSISRVNRNKKLGGNLKEFYRKSSELCRGPTRQCHMQRSVEITTAIPASRLCKNCKNSLVLFNGLRTALESFMKTSKTRFYKLPAREANQNKK